MAHRWAAHVGVRRHSEAIPALLGLGFWTTLVLGFITMLVSCVLCGLLFLACGSDCFVITRGPHDDPDAPLRLDEAIWLSIHTFSSIGYGSIYPTCAAGQILVLLEYYVSIVITAIISAALIFKFLKPLPHVAFSDNVLIDTSADIDGDGVPDGTYLTFRMAKECPHALTDCQIEVSATIKHMVGTGGQDVMLELRSSSIPELQAWVVWHKIDEYSPLYSPLHDVSRFVGLNVRLSVFDTIYSQTVRIAKHYTPADCECSIYSLLLVR